MKLALMSGLLMIGLTACSLSGPKYKVYVSECTWYKIVKLTPESKRRLKAGGPHAGVRRDVEAIISNNEKFKAICQ